MTLHGGAHNFYDVLSRQGADGKLLKPVELAAQSYPVIHDAMVEEGNLPLAEKTIQRTGLPPFAKRRANAGVAPTKSTTGVVIDTMMALEANSEIDELNLIGIDNITQYRMDEGNAFFESGAQAGAYYTWYGNELTAADEFTGFVPRYDALGDQVLDAGGSSNQCSIFVVKWDLTQGCKFIYPRGSQAGLRRIEGGRQRITDAVGGNAANYYAYCETFSWHFGLSIKRPDAVCRIANIDQAEAIGISGAQQLTDYGTFCLYLLEQAVGRVHNVEGGRTMIYMSRTMREALCRQFAATTHQNAFSFEQIDGRRVTRYMGLDVRTEDQLVEGESPVG
ncbi:MAG: hypothetical protein DRQ55_11215 [Planctomycetota bacterium]|nr:MAG: hypothetical protein DRQ55_11215 [Planctomycetota bacterium]